MQIKSKTKLVKQKWIDFLFMTFVIKTECLEVKIGCLKLLLVILGNRNGFGDYFLILENTLKCLINVK